MKIILHYKSIARGMSIAKSLTFDAGVKEFKSLDDAWEWMQITDIPIIDYYMDLVEGKDESKGPRKEASKV